MYRRLADYGLATLLLLGLPLLGVRLAGYEFGPYLEFPPLTRHVVHAGFSWPRFGLTAAVVVVLAMGLAGVVWQGCRRAAAAARPGGARPSQHAESAARPGGARPSQGVASAARPGGARPSQHATVATPGVFPWWGWAGLGLTLGAWGLAWTRLGWFRPWQAHTFVPLWLGYILVVNAWCEARGRRCLLLGHPRYYLALFPTSAVFWWFFEYLNRFVQNWYYGGVEGFTGLEYALLASLSFATVLPAVTATRELLLTVPGLNQGLTGWAAIAWPQPRRWALAALMGAAAGLTLLGVLPNLLYPLVWLAPLILVVAMQALAGRAHVLTPLGRGDWRLLATAPLAALACGWCWELWNWRSLAHWEYAVPSVDRYHLFAMPILGYAGYLPFGLECLALAALVPGAPAEVAPTAVVETVAAEQRPQRATP